MYIQKIHIENFRLLKNVDIVLDKSLTLIVGKNNTGKTSVAHLLQSIINEKKNLSFNDYPLECRKQLYEEYNSGDDSAYEQTTLKQFYEIKYGEVINAINFFKPDAVYSTDHGVKGEEYENVLFVMGRGWNLCKFEDSLYKDEKSLQGKELATYIRN